MKLKLFLAIVSSFFLLWVLGTVVFAQGEPPPPYTGLQNPFPWTDNATLATGKVIYQFSCQGCHGAFGNNLSQADFSVTRYSNNLIGRPDFYFWLLSEGRLPAMPAYKNSLSDQQRWQVLTYVWSLGAGPTTVALTPVSPTLEHGALPDCFRCHTRSLD
ncbi:MAG: cytochrome c, partial [Chloroflexota bacterium]